MSNLAEVDNLEIKVEATSRGANQQLKMLIGMMDDLSAKLNGMNTKNFESLATLMKSLSSMAGSVKNASNSIKEANKNIGDISETSKKAKKVLDDLFANSDKIGRNIPMPKGIIEQQNELKKLESEYDRLLQRQEKYVYTGNSMESKSWVNLQYDIIKTQNRMEDLKQSIESTKAKANEEIQFNVTVPNFDNEKFDLSDLILSQNTLGLERTFENFHTTVNNVFSDVRSDIDSVISKTVDLSNIDVSSVFQNMKIKDNAPAEIELIVGKYNKLREELLELENIYNDVAESSKNFTDAEQGETPVNVAKQTVERIQEVVAQMTSLRQSAKAINESIAKPFENLVDTSYLSEMNIKQLKEELKNTSAELEKINSQVSSWKDKSGNIDFNAVDNDALEDMNYYKQLIPQIENKIAELNSSSNKIDFSAIKNNANINIKETGNIFDGLWKTLSDGKGKIADFKNSIKGSNTYGAISGILKVCDTINSSAIKGFEKLKNTIGDISSKFVKLGSAMSKPLVMMLQFGGVGLIKKGFDGLNNALSNTYKQLIRTAKMFSLMILRKGLRAVIDNATNSFKDLARQSASVNASVSSLVSNFRWLGASITAAFSPILNVVSPILDALVEKCVSVINTIGQVFASLTGSGTYTYAKKVQVDYAGSLDDTASSAKDATKAVKEYENQLMGFDEINKLTDNKGSGSSGSGSGGSGGSGGASGYDYVFDTAQVEQQYANWAEMIKKAWNDGDFTEVGQIVGQKLADALDNIPWTSIQEKANKIAKSTATFINGAMHSDLFSEVGNTIGEALNTAFGVAYTYVNYFEFDKFGTETAKLLNNAFARTEFLTIANTISKSMNGVFDTAFKFAKEFEWDKNATMIVDCIKNALGGIKWEKALDASGELGDGLAKAINSIFSLGTETKDSLGESLGKAMSGALNTAIRFFSKAIGETKFENIGQNIADAINKILNETNWYEAGVTFSDGVKGILDVITKAISGINKDSITTAFDDFFGGIDWLGIAGRIAKLWWDSFLLKMQLRFETPINLMQDMIDWIIGDDGLIDKAFEGIGELLIAGLREGIKNEIKKFGWVTEYIIMPIVNLVKEGFGIHSPSTVFAEIGQYLIEGLKEGIKNAISNIGNWLKENVVDKIKNGISNLKDGALDVAINLKGKVDDTFNKAKDAWNGLKAGVKELWAKAKSTGEKAINSIKSAWNSIKAGTKSVLVKARTSGQSAIEKLKKAWKGLKSKTIKLGIKISGVVGNVKKVLNSKIIKPLNKKLPKIFPKIPLFAQGGFPNMGQMFIARERGPEMVGKIGSRNAVVNNNQIVEGVANGVYNAVVSAMATVGNNQGSNVNINLVGDTKKIFKVVQQEGRNYQLATGNAVF